MKTIILQVTVITSSHNLLIKICAKPGGNPAAGTQIAWHRQELYRHPVFLHHPFEHQRIILRVKGGIAIPVHPLTRRTYSPSRTSTWTLRPWLLRKRLTLSLAPSESTNTAKSLCPWSTAYFTITTGSGQDRPLASTRKLAVNSNPLLPMHTQVMGYDTQTDQKNYNYAN